MRILFVAPYPIGQAPSQRFRFEQYFTLLQQQGIRFDTAPFWSAAAWSILYQKGRLFKKALFLLFSFLKRPFIVIKAIRYDFIFIHREAAPIGPPVLEWILTKVLRKKVIFDFDDAIWLPNTSDSNRMVSWLKNHGKTAKLCQWSYVVSAGNSFLAQYAKRVNDNVVVNPTTIDLKHHNQLKKHVSKDMVTIGWTGSHSTNRYLRMVVPVLKQILEQFGCRIVIISDQDPHLLLKGYNFIRWNKQEEIDQLLQLDIGIMPLHDSDWEKGKCGFKALQYMSLGIPTVASPVGVNRQIIDDSKNGFLCSSEEEWINKLSALIKSKTLRVNMGKAGRKTVEDRYSTKANVSTFLSLFAK
ncbi:MAG TPA: group 1 glycosyl transferase [Cytophagales bacterium]|jgi:glycosyltransferase involved in cell wall biosynthesis|nr:group 1 glycosyl transferase [Cytophagales bacterium]